MRKLINIFAMIVMIQFLGTFVFAAETDALGGFISGMVHEPDGKTPVGGATVYAISIGNNTSSMSTTTNDDGSYLINLDSGTYQVEVFSLEFSKSTKSNVSVSNERNTSNVNFILIRAGYISGKVCEIDTITPIDNAVVRAIRQDGRVFSESVRNLGLYEIKLLPGNYRIEAFASGFLNSSYSNVKVDARQYVSDISFSLKAESFISGKVMESGGLTPIEGAAIFGIKDDGFLRFTLSKSDGTYKIEDLEEGYYAVVALARDHKPKEEVNVNVIAGQITSDVNFYLETFGEIKL